MKKIFLSVLILFTTFSYSQSLRSINIDSYKYIVVDEVSGGKMKETRRFIVKNLQKAGYNVVNLNNPLKTYDKFPEDLEDNPNLGLYLTFNTEAKFSSYETLMILYNYDNKELFRRSNSSGSLLSKAIKNTISSLTSYNYRYIED